MLPAALRRIVRSYYPLGLLLGFALVLRIALAPLWAYLPDDFTDEGFWKDWMLAIHQHGLLNIFRTSTTNYVGYHYILWLLTLVYDVVGGSYGHEVFRLHLLVKAPPILFDLGLIVAAYAVSRSLFAELGVRRAEPLALGAAAVIALQPAVVYDSAVWSQTDSAVTLAMLLALFFVARGRTKLGFGVWAAGFLLKPHPIIILPLLLYLTWRRNVKTLLPALTTVALVWLVALGPWLVHGDAPAILRVYRTLFSGEEARLSASAWNVWWFFDLTLHPSPGDTVLGLVAYRDLGFLLTVSAGFLALFYLHARPHLRGALIAAAYLAFAFYLLPVSTHDRYLYPFFAFMLPLAVVEKRWRPLYVAASATFFLNLVVVAPPIHAYSGRWTESPFATGVAALNCVLFGMFTLEIASVALPTLYALLRRRLRTLPALPSTLPDEVR